MIEILREKRVTILHISFRYKQSSIKCQWLSKERQGFRGSALRICVNIYKECGSLYGFMILTAVIEAIGVNCFHGAIREVKILEAAYSDVMDLQPDRECRFECRNLHSAVEQWESRREGDIREEEKLCCRNDLSVVNSYSGEMGICNVLKRRCANIFSRNEVGICIILQRRHDTRA